MEKVPLHYVLGRYNPAVGEEHYGVRGIVPFFCEDKELAGYRKAVTQVGTAWGLPIPDTQRWLDLIRQEEIAVTQAAEPEKVNHVMEEKDLPINASGLQTLDNIWGLFETAVKLNSADGRREMYALARELSECQNLTDWIIKSQTENEGAQVSMACTQN